MKRASVCFMRSSESRNVAIGQPCEFDVVHCEGPGLRAASVGNGVHVRESGTYRIEVRGYVLPMAPGDIGVCVAPSPCSESVRELCTVMVPCESVRATSIAGVLAVVPCKAGSVVSLSFERAGTLLAGASLAVTRVT